jgi:hypothetical protein
VLNKPIRNEDVWGNWGLAPRTGSPGTKWTRVISFKPGRFTPGETPTPRPLDKRLGEPQTDLIAMARRKITALLGIEPRPFSS